MSNREVMDDETYLMTQQEVVMMGNLLRNIQAAEFLVRLEHADTIGPMIHTSHWRAASPKLEIIRKFAKAVVAAQRELPSVEEIQKACAESSELMRIIGV